MEVTSVTFFSNFISEHQIPFCEEMYHRLGAGFTFVETEPISNERLQLGFIDKSFEYEYVLKTYESEKNSERALELAINSDIVIIGSASDILIADRVKIGKLTFRYHERFFKRGKWRLFDPRVLKQYYNMHIKYRNNSTLHMLCASAYTSGDAHFIGSYIGRTYKWGYFPKVMKYNLADLFKKKNNDTLRLLWVGRLIECKHPEFAVKIADRLKKEGYNFTLEIIGIGYMKDYLLKLIQEYNLLNTVKMLGSMRPEEVREHMEVSDIFLFTSDYNEGWGAVLNEAMNSCCAVVASHAIGAVPYLIHHGQNGLIYKSGDMNELYTHIKKLLCDNELRKSLGIASYKSMIEQWNARIATDRLLELFESLLNNEKVYFDDGPCSIASPVPQRKMYRYSIEERSI